MRLRYTGAEGAGRFCMGFGQEAGVTFAAPAAGPKSFVLADKLAYCRFSYMALPKIPQDPRIWTPIWATQGWPIGIRVEMAPLTPNPARLQPITVIAPCTCTGRRRWRIRINSGFSRKRGSALLAVLWLSAALAAIGFSLASTVRGEAERTSTAVDSLRSYYMAQGAVQRCLLELLWSITYPESAGRAQGQYGPQLPLSERRRDGGADSGGCQAQHQHGPRSS